MSSSPPSPPPVSSSVHPQSAFCEVHGLHFDSKTGGCVICRRHRGRSTRWRGLWWLVAALVLPGLAMGGYALYRMPVAAGNRKHVPLPGRLATTNAVGRSCAYLVPDNPGNRPMPLMVVLHASGWDGESMVAAFYIHAVAHRFAIIAPESHAMGWQIAENSGDRTGDFLHIMACVDEFLQRGLAPIDPAHVLIVGYSAGASTAPYVATNVEMFTAFAMMHGGVFPDRLGPRRVRGWMSTGLDDQLRPPNQLRQHYDQLRRAGFADLELRFMAGGHSMSPQERQDLVIWWLK